MKPSQQNWKRARRPEQIAQRRDEILRAAAELVDQQGLEGAGLNAIARQAGSAKANIYRYFESREAILIELMIRDFSAWIADLNGRLARINPRPGATIKVVDAIATDLASTLARRPRLCVFIEAHSSILERNVTAETVIAFKRKVRRTFEPLLAALGALLTPLPAERIYWFTMIWLLAAGGLWPASHPAPVVAKVLRRKEFAPMKIGFEDTVRQLAVTMLRGLLAEDYE